MTVQDYTQTALLKYDINRVFALLEFTSAPPATLVLSATL